MRGTGKVGVRQNCERNTPWRLQWTFQAEAAEPLFRGTQDRWSIFERLHVIILRRGRGEVYRVRDTKLNHEMALKVLPLAFAQAHGAF